MRTRVTKYFKAASAVILMGWALLPTSADAQGIVLTGGTLNLDFADAAIGGNSTTLDRLDKLTWSGGSGGLAGQNLVSNSGAGGDCNGDPHEFWGQSYGEPEGTDPLIIFAGTSATASNLTATSMTTTATGTITCGCGNNSQAGAPTTTVYNVFPAGDPNVNEAALTLAPFSVITWLKQFSEWSMTARLMPTAPPPPGVAIRKAAALAEGKDPDTAVAEARAKV